MAKKVFTEKARKRIASAVDWVEGRALTVEVPVKMPGHPGKGAGSMGAMASLLLGKVADSNCTGTDAAWASPFTVCNISVLNYVAGKPPAASKKKYNPKKGTNESVAISAINPGCVTIPSGTPVICGMLNSGDWVIIFVMCDCSGY